MGLVDKGVQKAKEMMGAKPNDPNAAPDQAAPTQQGQTPAGSQTQGGGIGDKIKSALGGQ